MEKNKNIRDRELEIIHHIKFIAADLYSDQEKLQEEEQAYQLKDPYKQFVRTPYRKQSQPTNNRKSFTQYNTQSYSQIQNEKSRKKKPSIFTNFEQLLERCNKSQQRKETTPIIDRINQGIYNQFKTESKVKNDLSQSVLNCQERQALWDDFLTRGEKWQKEKKKHQRQRQMQGVFRQQNNLQRSHTKTSTNLIANQLKMEKQMSQVEKSLRKIRLQTQKLRLKVLQIDNGQNKQSKSTFKKTYK